jgi:hypothetical protein
MQTAVQRDYIRIEHDMTNKQTILTGYEIKFYSVSLPAHILPSANCSVSVPAISDTGVHSDAH